MRILLHICCAPCAIYPFQELTKDCRNSVTGFFYNPNIHPFTEMEKRRMAVEDYAAKAKFNVIFGEFDIENFFKEIGTEIDAPYRCHACWKMRLGRCAGYARENNFDAFTTTLLASPYQDRDELIRIGFETANIFGITFLDNDFREGFGASQQFARNNEMYRQKYCGCIFSERERYNKKPRSQQPRAHKP